MKLPSKEWKIIKNHHLERTYLSKDFRQALAFVNIIGKIAEKEDHHPDILLKWKRVKIKLYTHGINGLSKKDFSLAKKIESVYKKKY